MEESFDPVRLYAIGDFPDYGPGFEEEDPKDKAPVESMTSSSSGNNKRKAASIDLK